MPLCYNFQFPLIVQLFYYIFNRLFRILQLLIKQSIEQKFILQGGKRVASGFARFSSNTKKAPQPSGCFMLHSISK